MTTKSPYDILFDSVAIGPVTAPNRFFQVPHCNGMGHLRPRAVAAMRGVKAEGGWGVISTEEVEIHPSAEISPYAEGRLWDDADIPAMQLMTDAVHAHGSLAAVELCHNGMHAPNLLTRVPPMGPSNLPVDSHNPVQARAMSSADIRNLIRWHCEAALRAKRAGFDIVYVYAGHSMSTLMHFMQARHNDRTDEYGGSLENRVRLTREILEGVKDAVGDTCAVAFRFAVDELIGDSGLQADAEGRDTVEMLAEIPDLWDVNVSNWGFDSATARFQPAEGYQDAYTAFVKSVTTRPVVGVGRYTDVDAMVARVKKGHLDFIGAARPSIADPFLPNKIRENRIEEIRECIGCNICVSGDNQIAPMRCTQNPTVGEEWRRQWHPERIAPAKKADRVLIVGAGPAGLESAMALSERGFHVTLAERREQAGGRLIFESSLPGMSSYLRVRDYRLNKLKTHARAELFFDSEMDAAGVREFDARYVLLATGSMWRKDGGGRSAGTVGIPRDSDAKVLTPDDLAKGASPSGQVLVYDDDHYYMGAQIALKLAGEGANVLLVTPANALSAWTEHTLEQPFVYSALLEAGVQIQTGRTLASIQHDHAMLACAHTGAESQHALDAVVLVTARLPDDALFCSLDGDTDERLCLIGDAHAPGHVAAAVYSGHLSAREIELTPAEREAFLYRREMSRLDDPGAPVSIC